MNEEKIIQKLIEHDERLARIEKNMVTKDDFNALLEGQDKMMTILIKTG